MRPCASTSMLVGLRSCGACAQTVSSKPSGTAKRSVGTSVGGATAIADGAAVEFGDVVGDVCARAQAMRPRAREKPKVKRGRVNDINAMRKTRGEVTIGSG